MAIEAVSRQTTTRVYASDYQAITSFDLYENVLSYFVKPEQSAKVEDNKNLLEEVFAMLGENLILLKVFSKQ